jgi:hypothetical protein
LEQNWMGLPLSSNYINGRIFLLRTSSCYGSTTPEISTSFWNTVQMWT